MRLLFTCEIGLLCCDIYIYICYFFWWFGKQLNGLLHEPSRELAHLMQVPQQVRVVENDDHLHVPFKTAMGRKMWKRGTDPRNGPKWGVAASNDWILRPSWVVDIPSYITHPWLASIRGFWGRSGGWCALVSADEVDRPNSGRINCAGLPCHTLVLLSKGKAQKFHPNRFFSSKFRSTKVQTNIY